MKIKNLLKLSKVAIEGKSVSVLKHFNSEYFTHCRPTPVFGIIDKLRCQKYLEYDESANLGFSVDSSRILGGYVPSKNTILIDKSLVGLPSKLHFVQAHELGHFVLHRKVLLAEESKYIEDSESQLENQKRKLITDYDFMEWQANYFASTLLLPEPILRNKLIRVREELGLTWRGFVYVDNQRCTQDDYHETLRRLAEFFKVSKTVVEIRLQDMGIVTDNRKHTRGYLSIGDILRDLSS